MVVDRVHHDGGDWGSIVLALRSLESVNTGYQAKGSEGTVCST